MKIPFSPPYIDEAVINEVVAFVTFRLDHIRSESEGFGGRN